MNYWWMNTDSSHWDIFESLRRGQVEAWAARTESGRYKANMKDVQAGDRGLCYQTHDRAVLVAELISTAPLGLDIEGEEAVFFRLEEFIEPVPWAEIVRAKVFNQGRIKILRRPSLSKLSQSEFESLLRLSGALAKKKDQEQSEIIADEVQRPLSEISNELRNAKASDPQLITYKGQKYSRDNQTVSRLKILREFKCQLCGTTIRKRDGSKYIEAAHIAPKKERGNELPSNLIVLCPNHHKEFDFGNLSILQQDNSRVRFRLNDVEYDVNLSV